MNLKQECIREMEERQSKTKKIVYSTVQTIVDKTTGEILADATETKFKTDAEPDFIKVYFKSMLAVNGMDGLPLSFVMALASQINYCGEDKPIYFYNNKATRARIAECCLKANGEQISDNMVSRYIKVAKDVSLLFDTNNKGIYEVNPFMIAKGQWKHISKLQASFNFTGKKWIRSMEINNDEESDNQ